MSGKPFATLVNFPLVPKVLDETNTLISADFPHWLYLDLERSRDEVVMYVCAEETQLRIPGSILNSSSFQPFCPLASSIPQDCRQAGPGIRQTGSAALPCRLKSTKVTVGHDDQGRVDQSRVPG